MQTSDPFPNRLSRHTQLGIVALHQTKKESKQRTILTCDKHVRIVDRDTYQIHATFDLIIIGLYCLSAFNTAFSKHILVN